MASVGRGFDAHGRVGPVGGAAVGAGGLRQAIRAQGSDVPSVLDTKYVLAPILLPLTTLVNFMFCLILLCCCYTIASVFVVVVVGGGDGGGGGGGVVVVVFRGVISSDQQK